MRILLASSNPHKLEEIRAVFTELAQNPELFDGPPQRRRKSSPPPKVELVSLRDVNLSIPEPVEDGQTFEANAVKKAQYYARAANMFCLADDSGLEVDALKGDPGVRSARYADMTGPRDIVDPANNALLLERLYSTPAKDRQARFVCVMALCAPERLLATAGRGRKAASPPPVQEGQPEPVRTLAVVHGTVEGRIIGPDEHPRGENGFGYDPLFIIPSLGMTSAELSQQEKNRISHRGNAARLMWQALRRMQTALRDL